MNTPESQRPHIGHNIRMLRELRNYTQEYMAHSIGISRQSYSRLEQAEDTQTVHVLQKIAGVLNITIFDILTFEEHLRIDTLHSGRAFASMEMLTELLSSESGQNVLALLQQMAEKL